MKLAMCSLLMFFSLSAFAERLESRIHSIDTSLKKNSPHLIKLENARVVFINFNDHDLLQSFKDSLKQQLTLEIEVDGKNNFLSAGTVEASHEALQSTDETEQLMSYEPTTVTPEMASTIFQRMRRNYQNNSQCYNRAHVWALEEFNKSNLNSIKLFLFFTSRYIRNYRYKWWFHVSPMVQTTAGDRVLDRRYTSGPREIDSWLKNFIFSGRKCPVVNRYSNYRNNQQKEDCYLIPVSMYFWQPRDIDRRDRTGFEKTKFYQSEVDHAYWEAF